MAFFHVLIAFVLLDAWQDFSIAILMDTFTKSSICNVTERIRFNCSWEVQNIPSLFYCSAQCIKHGDCNGVSLGPDGTCFLHKDCPYWFDCNGPHAGHQYFERHCLHGAWNVSTKSCDCPEKYSGPRCEIHPRVCKGITQETKMIRVFLDPEQSGESPVPVSCEMPDGNVFVLRNKIRVSLNNRTWEEYKKGFYVDEDHEWLGLDAWSRLSKVGCQTVTSRLVLNENGGLRKYTELTYEELFVLNETNRFELIRNGQISGRIVNMPGSYLLANCFAGRKQTPFSTWDRDNDGDPWKNCAAITGAGWWYSRGFDSRCNLFGVVPSSPAWNTTPAEQRFYLEGADLADWLTEDSYMDIFLQFSQP